MSVSINGTSGLVFNDASTQNTAATGFGFKNRIINGAMVIDQRNAGASVTQTVAAVYTLDRWQMFGDVTSKFSVQQDAGAVTPPVGFNDYLGVTSLSSYTLATDDRFFVRHKIEGFNTADLDFGKATAKTVTLSFWVRSSLTGTFGGSIQNGAGNRSYPFTFTINSANTWEYETITIAGDTSGTWLTTNGIGLVINFGLGVQGSTYAGTAGAWNSNNNYSATGATSVVGTNGATFYITGVQLEKGSTATSFDYRPYGTELALCQRYFETSYNYGNTAFAVPTNSPSSSYVFLKSGTNTIAGGTGQAQETMGPCFYKAQKRAAPTLTIYSYTSSTTSAASNGWTGADLVASSGSVGDNFNYGFTVVNKSGGNVTTGGYGIIFGFAASAEL
jgi:hypothetical protein